MSFRKQQDTVCKSKSTSGSLGAILGNINRPLLDLAKLYPDLAKLLINIAQLHGWQETQSTEIQIQTILLQETHSTEVQRQTIFYSDLEKLY